MLKVFSVSIKKSQARVDLRRMAKSINLTKIEFLFSSTKNSFEGKRVCLAFGNVL